ncbi:MAG: amino acid adenylation domain-containing protein [Bacteroidota bacterium]
MTSTTKIYKKIIKDYWVNKLASADDVFFPNTSVGQQKPFNTLRSVVDPEVAQAISRLANHQEQTVFVVFLAFYHQLLARYFQAQQALITSPSIHLPGSEEDENKASLVFFKLQTSVNDTVKEGLMHVRAEVQEVINHQEFDYQEFLDQLSRKAIGQAVLYQYGFSYDQVNAPSADFAQVKLQVGIYKVADTYEVEVCYDTALYSSWLMQQFLGHYQNLLKTGLKQLDTRAIELPLLSSAEIEQLINEHTKTKAPYPDQCIHELFEEQVGKNPDAVAVVFEDQELTYGELNRQANQLAHYLIEHKQVKPDSLVGICVDRSLEMVIGILGILKAGGAYVPLDPDYPEARLAYMLEDAQLSTVLTQSHLLSRTPISVAQALCLDEAAVQAQLRTQSIENTQVDQLGLQSHHLAYVIYTSGSTGNPKGVMVAHGNVTRLMHSCQEHFDFNSQDVWTMFHSYAFDFSVWEIWGALSKGGRLVVVPYWVTRSSSDFYQLLQKEQVTVLNQTPSAFSNLMQEQASTDRSLALRYVIFGGEALNLASLIPWIDKHGEAKPKLINMYGITETTVHVTYLALTNDMIRHSNGASFIGRPLSDLQVLILNEAQVLVPVGVVGEMYVSGAGVTRGYLNQAELTANRFVEMAGFGNQRFYRTGDLAHYYPNGELNYLGRIDHQVKIRGFRIELGEIENALLSSEEVAAAVVVAKESSVGDKRLVAYVVAKKVDTALQDEAAADVAQPLTLTDRLRQHLGQTLPEYMVPAVFVWLESLPLTPNGKVDRKALPEPEVSQQQASYVAPRTETEQVLCEIWQEVLGVERVGITDNFFQRGGHSLSATRLVARINQVFKVALSLKAIFTSPTLEALGQELLQLERGVLLPALVRVSREQVLLPSYAQQRLWLLDQIDGGSAHYNMPAALKLSGQLNYAALNQAFGSILERHESLRTCFTLGTDGQPIQVIQPAAPLAIAITDLSPLTAEEQQLSITQLVEEESGRVFDLSQDRMLRVSLLQLAVEEHILLVTMHHIASDGWSMSILVNEFTALYQIYLQGQENPLSALPIQYADYAHWQRNWLQGEVLDQQLGYWTKQLASLPVVHGLPLDHPRPKRQTFAGNNYLQQLDAASSQAFTAFCQSQGATLFMGLHAAFSVLLSRYSNETDIVVGSPIANREQAEVAGLIGFFVNTIVLRSDLSESPSFSRLLAQSKHTLLDAYAHQQVPFEYIVECLQPERNLTHSPLFQVLLVLQNNAEGNLEIPGLTLSQVERSSIGIAKYDLTLTVTESAEGLWLGWEYNTDLFESGTIARMATHFEALLQGLLATPEESVFTVEMLSAAERQQQLVEWNATATDYPADKCIHELFEAQVVKNPEAVAVVFEGQQLTYGELNRQANQLAHYLIEHKQVMPDSLVGICIDRSLDMVIGILGILKAGGAYVPLDPDYPQARLAYMLEDAQLSTVLTQTHLLSRTPVSAAQALCLDEAVVQAQLRTQSIENTPVDQQGLQSHHLAYVIYTSGSTGNPKGVMVEQSSVVSLVIENGYVPLSSATILLHNAPIAFDAATFELWGALLNGGKVVIQGASLLDMASLGSFIAAHEINTAWMTAGLFDQFVQAYPGKISSLKYLLVGGDVVSKHTVEIAQQHYDHLTLINGYGPTENTTFSCFYSIPAQLDTATSIPIGKPLSNRLAYVMAHGTCVPIGVAGELHVGGAGLARGYLNRPDLTAEKFIPNPFYDPTDPASSERLYKTGDLVRWLPDGNLEFLGRIDHQVKIRGFRIELGEIENALTCHPQVREAVVLARQSSTGDKRLVAYVATAGADNSLPDESQQTVAHSQALIDQLRQHLSQMLPEYMVPSAFVWLDRLPLTPNGKVDRKALPEPDVSLQQASYVAPQTATERLLCEIWQAVLSIEQVGITDNFFQLGGHSLLVMQVIARLQKQGLAMVARQLFITPTLGDLAQALDHSAATNIPAFQAPANLIPADCTQITPDMLPLVSLTSEEIETIVSQVPGGVAQVQDIYSLAPLQEGILFHHRMSTQGDPYVLAFVFSINGKEAVTEFLNALQFIIDRHEVLRTAILWDHLSVPVQVVYRQASLPVTWLELDPAQEAYAQMQALCAPEKQWMDIGQAPLLRLQVAADHESAQHFVLLQFHHIISDHVGLEIIQKEVGAYQAGLAASLPQPIPYREFVAHALHQAAHHDAEGFFSQMLGEVAEPTLPFGLVDVQGDGSRIVEARASVPTELASQIRQIARDQMISPAALFHTAWAMVVSVCSSRWEEVVFGTVLSGRLQGTIGAESMLGVFINTLPFRVNLGNSSVSSVVQQVHEDLLNLLPYEQVSLALAQGCSGVSDGSPLFSAILNYRHSSPAPAPAPADNIENSDSSVETGIEFLSGQERTNYPFNLSVDDLGNGFGLDVQVDAWVSAERIVTYMQMAVAGLVEALLSAPDQAIRTVSILPDTERHQLLLEWNHATANYPADQCMHQLFEAQVAKTPDAVAVVFKDQPLTYEELNAQANRLAHHLRQHYGVKPDDLVGLMVHRSERMIIGMLAILKAGGAYVPIDPTYPEERKAFILSDAGIQLLLTESAVKASVPTYQHSTFLIDTELPALSTSVSNPVLVTQVSDLAYVIYTSGSTGKPKGVMIEHRGNVNMSTDQVRRFGITPQDKVLQFASLSFDASVYEIFMAFYGGATLVLIDKQQLDNTTTFEEYIQSQQVTVATLPPAYLSGLDKDSLHGLRVIITAGEAANVADALACSAFCDYYNAYGPTEASVCVSTYLVNGQEEGSIQLPIGTPIDNISLYVLDEQGGLLPIGLAGELCVSGVGVARGYLNRPELTLEKFVPNPYQAGERLYKTGDLVRWNAAGQLEFMGRIDEQMKLRGFRIEPGEIASVLSQHPAVQEAWVMKGAADELMAIVVPRKEILVDSEEQKVAGDAFGEAFIHELQQLSAQQLPAYMVPTVFKLVESLPLTLNGKVDKKALLRLPGLFTEAQPDYVAARNELEQQLVEIWQEVLGKTPIGIYDNFFELGGHSLKATKLVSWLYRSKGVKLELKNVFLHPTIASLAQLIGQSSLTAFEEIPQVEEQAYYELSHAQRRLWILHQFEENKTAYNVPSAYVFTGEVNLTALQAAFQSLIERHEVLRTTFVMVDGEPKQQIHPASSWTLTYAEVDLREYSDKETRLKQLMHQEEHMVFDLEKGPLLRSKIFQMEPETYVFVFTMHHIISDGWSMQVFIREVIELYTAYNQGETIALPALRIQYKEYAAWQKSQLSGQNLERHQAFWWGQFRDEQPVLALPTDYPRPLVKTFNGRTHTDRLAPELMDGLNRLAQQSGATLFMALEALWKTLLYKYTGQEDITLGTPLAGRNHPDLENQIGYYINTLALRTQFSGKQSFRELLHQIKANTMEAFTYQAYPFDRLIDELSLSRDMSRSPLFDIMLVLQNFEEKQADVEALSEVTVDGMQIDTTTSQFDLKVVCKEISDGLVISLDYNTDLFKPDRIARLFGHLQTLAADILCNADASLESFGYITAQEEEQVLREFNQTKTDYPANKRIHELFEAMAAQQPEAPAMVFEGQIWSYAQVNEQANSLAAYLVTEYGVSRGDLIGVMLNRHPHFLIAMVAILKAGGAYVPLSPTYPKERLQYLLEDTQPKVLLTQSDYLFDLDYFEGNIFALDVQLEGLSRAVDNLAQAGDSNDLAYIMYTSGTTGKPKGVMIEHRSVVRLIQHTNYVQLGAEDRLLQTGSLAFDASTFEVWGMWLNGGVVYLLSDEQLLQSQGMKDTIRQEAISVMWLTSSWFNQLVETDLSVFEGLKQLLVGGEKLSSRHIHRVRQAYPALTVINGYGPTENTTFSICYPIQADFAEEIPLGYPIANSQVYILDDLLRPVPMGIEGEIYLGGDGLARGYLNNPELTQQKFIAHPYAPGQRLYKTGDLGKWLEGGKVAFAGRRDSQLKIRGYRVEPAEIEQVLLGHSQLEQAVVLGFADDQGINELVAFVVGEVIEADLRPFLASQLPSYMIPAEFVVLDTLPLTANGKVDKRALALLRVNQAAKERHYEAPRDLLDTQLAEIWQEVLRTDRVGIDDNFFELGGHSLRATQLVSRVYKQLEASIDLGQVFAFPTIRQLADIIKAGNQTGYEEIPRIPEAAHYEVSAGQKRLWVLNQLEGEVTTYNMSGSYELEGDFSYECLEKVLNTLQERHEILRTTFETPEGDVRQVVYPVGALPIKPVYQDLTEITGAEQMIDEIMRVAVSKKFDLSKEPLLRVNVLKITQDKHICLFVMHHIISDGWSLKVTMHEMGVLYQAYREGRENPLEPLRIQYKDYAAWQQTQSRGEALQKHREYAAQEFGGSIPTLNLLNSSPRPAVKSIRGSLVETMLDRETALALNAFSQKHNCSLFMTLLAGFNALLYRYSGQQDLIVGTVDAGRAHPDLEDQIGFYVNTLAIRTQFDGEDSLDELLEKTKRKVLLAYEHLAYPFDALLNDLNVQWDRSRSPLFDVVLSLQNTDVVNLEAKEQLQEEAKQQVKEGQGENEMAMRGYKNQVSTSMFDLVLNLNDTSYGLVITTSYNTDLFTEASIFTLNEHFMQVLRSMVADSASKINALLSTESLPSSGDSLDHSMDYEFNF